MIKVSYNQPTNQYFLTDNEISVELTQTSIDPKTKKVKLKLPENSANRVWVDQETVRLKGEIELDYKESRHLGTINRGPRKKDEDYMTDEEKAIIADIMAKVKERREADKPRPLTELEKLELKIKKYQEQLEKLKNQ